MTHKVKFRLSIKESLITSVVRLQETEDNNDDPLVNGLISFYKNIVRQQRSTKILGDRNRKTLK